MQYNPAPTPHVAVARAQPPGLFSPVMARDYASVSNTHLSQSSAHSESRSAISRSQAHGDAAPLPSILKPLHYTRAETTFLVEEAKAKLLGLHQQEESLSVHLEAKKHALLHLKSEIARTDQVIREFERKRVHSLSQDASDSSLSPKDLEEVEKLSQEILKEERTLSQLQAVLAETMTRNAAFQDSLNRDRADRDEIKAVIARITGKSPAAP